MTNTEPLANPYAAPRGTDPITAGDLDSVREEVVRIEPAVWKRGYQVHAAGSSKIRRIVFPIAGGLFLLYAVFTFFVNGWVTTVFLSGLLALYFLLISLFVRWLVHRRIIAYMEQTGGRVQDAHYRLEPEWLEISTENAQVRLRLAGLYLWREAKGVILLYQTAMHYQVVPCFDWSRESTDALRARLWKHVGAPNRKTS